MDSFRPAFEDQGMRLTEVSWDDTSTDWNQFDAVLIGTTWDYWDRRERFLETLEQIESQTRLFNSSALVRWNSNKRYLKDFADSGIHLIPTAWIDQPTTAAVEATFTTFGCEKIVIKRQVGAGADGQHLLQIGDQVPDLVHPMMAQPFFSSIQCEGELSMIFVDGQFSHGLLKHAAAGDYRIQSTYGGTEEAIAVSEADQATASQILASLPETALYARVDMLRGDSGDLYLMELELIEPYLYPLEGPGLGQRMAAALRRRLDIPA